MKNGKKVLAALLVSSMVVVPMSIYANTKVDNNIVENKETKSEYIELRGIIKEVNGSGEKMSLLVGNKDNKNDDLIVHVADDVYVSDMKPTRENKRIHLVKDAEVSVFYHKNTPMALSLPGQITPRAIIVRNDDKLQVKLDKFDKNLVSSDGMLKLNMKDEKEYQDEVLLVYYGASTKSIPAQTTPELVVVLGDRIAEVKVEENKKIEKLDGIKYEGKDFKASLYHKTGDVTMISLRDISDIMKYELKWNGKDKPMELTKLPFWTSLQIGKNSYFYNKVAPFELSSAPELRDGKTYVPVEFISEVLQKEVKVVNGVLEVK